MLSPGRYNDDNPDADALRDARPASFIALGGLALMAIVLGVNLVGATERFVAAYVAYDRLELELTEFHYTDPDTPIRAVLVVSNPASQPIVVEEIELRVNAGVRPVGGNQIRVETDPEATAVSAEEKYRLEPGETQAFPIDLHISESDYVARLGTSEIDWRVRGRIQVVADEGMQPEWIPFVVRYIPE